MLRYAITDRASLPGTGAEKNASLLQLAALWAAEDIDFVQLREKNMDAGALTALARQLTAVLGAKTKLLINGRADVALAARAAGVHLTARPGELTPQDVRRLWALLPAPKPFISVACHSVEEAAQASAAGADLILFAPVFEKRVEGRVVSEGCGLQMLAQACEAALGTPVLAMGGITSANAQQCVAAGAAGVAGIRLFMEGGER